MVLNADTEAERDEEPAEAAESAPLDENLTALAEAEAAVEAIGARFAAGDQTLPYEVVMARTAAERRRRGYEAWGFLSLAMAAAAWAWPVLEGVVLRRHPQPVTFESAEPVEGCVILAAAIFGTIGCRRIAGRRMALFGRTAAWSAPALLWLANSALGTYRGDDSGNLVIAGAGSLIWIAMGLFTFAILDALIAP